jgi:hypothetical protein
MTRFFAALLLLCSSLASRRAGTGAVALDATPVFACTGGEACTFLGSLYYATGGSSWTNNSGWAEAANGTTTLLCSMYGVSCSVSETLDYSVDYTDITTTSTTALSQATTTVSTINLKNNNLDGSLPPSGWLGLSRLTLLCVPHWQPCAFALTHSVNCCSHVGHSLITT